MSEKYSKDRIVAVGLLSIRDLETLGPTFRRAYRVDETPCFGELLSAIDEADREMRQNPPSDSPVFDRWK